MKLLFKILIGIALGICLALLIIFIIYGAQSVILETSNFVLPNSQSSAQAQLFIESIPPLVFILPIFLVIALFILLYRNIDSVSRFIKQGIYAIWSSLKKLFSQISYTEYIILLVPFIASIYFALNVPVSYDEAITYNLFTSKPFYFAAIFYPYPNNHVLHSLMTSFSDLLPIGDALFRMRIPVILVNIFTWIVALSFFKKFYTSKTAILAVGCCTVFWMTIYYSFMSRGYAMMVMCTVICFYIAFNIIKNGGKRRDWFYYGVFAIIGTYTIPSFLYPLATINLILLIFKFKDIKKLIVVNLVIGISVMLLYLPIVLVDGVGALTNNSFVQKVSRIDILEGIHYFYWGILTQITGVSFSFFWVVLFFFPVLLVLKNREKSIFWIVLFTAPFVLVFVQAVNPFYRTFLYYNFFIVFLFFVSSEKLLKYIPFKLCFLVIVIQIFAVINFSKTIGEKETFNTDVNRVVTTFFNDNTSIVFPCTASANYLFEVKARGLEDQVSFWENEKASADSIHGIQYVIIGKDDDETQKLKPIYKSDKQNIYRLY